MRLNWHTVNAIMKAPLGRGLERREREPIAYLGLDEPQQAGIKAVAMDIWSACRNAVRGVLAKADIVHDKDHLCAYLNKAVDTVRKAEHRQLVFSGRQTQA